MIGGEHEGHWTLVVKGKGDTYGVLCVDGRALRAATKEAVFGTSEIYSGSGHFESWGTLQSALEQSNQGSLGDNSVEWVPILKRKSFL